MSSPVGRRPLARAATASAAAAIVIAILCSCEPEPSPDADATPSARPTRSASPSESADPSPSTSASPSPLATEPAEAAFALPEECEQIYSTEMLSSLTAQNPPLNDPGVTMHSTQNVEALELLASGVRTLRCSWGRPSEYGLATNVTLAGAARTASLLEALRAAGFGCENVWEGTLCQIEQRTVDHYDNEVVVGESHFVRGDAWVSTAWINFTPEGYTEDVVATLWG